MPNTPSMKWDNTTRSLMGRLEDKVSAVSAYEARISALESRNEELEAKNTKLEAENTKLEGDFAHSLNVIKDALVERAHLLECIERLTFGIHPHPSYSDDDSSGE